MKICQNFHLQQFQLWLDSLFRSLSISSLLVIKLQSNIQVIVFFKIMNENMSKFPLTTISALGCWTASSVLYLFLLFLLSNCKVIYNSSNKKTKQNKTKTNHQTQLAYSHNNFKKNLSKHISPSFHQFPSRTHIATSTSALANISTSN